MVRGREKGEDGGCDGDGGLGRNAVGVSLVSGSGSSHAQSSDKRTLAKWGGVGIIRGQKQKEGGAHEDTDFNLGCDSVVGHGSYWDLHEV